MAKYSPQEKIQISLLDVREEFPFFGELVFLLNYEKNEKTSTLSIDKNGKMRYNPEFIKDFSLEKVKACLVHEVMHPAFKHFDRKGSRNSKLWNIAGDIVINKMIKDQGMILPEGALIPEKNKISLGEGQDEFTIKNIDEKTVEQVYDVIKDNVDIENIEKSGFDKHIYKPDEEKEDEEGNGFSGQNKVDWDSAVERARDVVIEEGGDSPLGADRIAKIRESGNVDWRKVLHSKISRKFIVDEDWTRPDPNFRHLGVVLPSPVRKGLEVIVALDTSGSITEEKLGHYLSHLRNLNNSFKHIEIEVIQHDYSVQSREKLKKVEDLELKGGGGTSHIPVFEEIEGEHPDVFIGFTDGFTRIPEKKPNFDVIWLIDNETADMNWGEIIRVEPD